MSRKIHINLSNEDLKYIHEQAEIHQLGFKEYIRKKLTGQISNIKEPSKISSEEYYQLYPYF